MKRFTLVVALTAATLVGCGGSGAKSKAQSRFIECSTAVFLTSYNTAYHPIRLVEYPGKYVEAEDEATEIVFDRFVRRDDASRWYENSRFDPSTVTSPLRLYVFDKIDPESYSVVIEYRNGVAVGMLGCHEK